MPAFLFLTGYNIKFKPQNIVFRWFIPYLVFQFLHITYSGYVLGNHMILQFTTPYWSLWYLLACVFYQILLPLYDVDSERHQFFIMTIVVILALVVGYDDSIGKYMTLSRFFVFQPWFLLGLYFKKRSIFRSIFMHSINRMWLERISIYGILLSIVYLYVLNIENRLLYGSFSYKNYGITIGKRAIVMLIALCWIVFLLVVIKPYINKKIPLVTTIGQNTLSIYLLHGFVVKALPIFCPVIVSAPWSILLISAIILILFGNKFCQKGIHYLCFGWLEKYLK